MLYCVKCRKKTKDAEEPVVVTTKNGRHMAKAKCSVCGTTKTQFVK